MYGTRFNDRRNSIIRAAVKIDGLYRAKPIRKFDRDFRDHAIVQHILEYNGFIHLSDFILTNVSLVWGSFSCASERFKITKDRVSSIWYKAHRLEKCRLKAMGAFDEQT